MNSLRIFIFFLLFFSPFFWRWAGPKDSYGGGEAFAQRSKHGAKVVATPNNTVNEYTALSADAAAGAVTITVTASTLNATGRFPANLAPGDLIMIIQMQGATILGSLSGSIGTPADSTWGAITAYNDCGNWEFAEVLSVPNATSISLACPLKNNYTAAGKVQVVRVQRYSSLTINAGGVITCDPWNGTVGGICAIEVENNTVINAGGSINTSGSGFRGGQILDNTTQLMNLFFSASTLNVDGAEKGESIAGYKATYNPYGGMYMRGAPANAGGGGSIHNGGGGGGANGGNPAAWNGHGMPDPTPAYAPAWDLQYAGFSTQVSSGGGQGGYAWSAANGNPTTQGPCNPAWGGQSRCAIGGYGGRPLDYSTGRLFLGGGGGAGDQNDNCGGEGANGGGLIYLMSYGTVSGTGQLISNGNAGLNSRYFSIGSQYKDGAGGGGAGGTIIVNSVGAISGVTLTANGGKGGDQLFVLTDAQAEGPGGGGGGGYISISNGVPVRTTNGGVNGITNSTGVNPEFPPNGATAGGAGTNNAVVTNFIINAANTTICTGQAATLTATLSPAQGGTSIIWYDAPVAGNVLPSTGGTLTTSVIATAGTYTYYVASCPGTYHQPVLVTVTNTPAVLVSPNTTICTGGNTTLDASGGSTYSWSPATGLSNPNISNPIASPAATTTYVVTVTTSCGSATASVVVTVTSSPPVPAGVNSTICAGASTTLNASGGSAYSWSPTAGLSNPTISNPVATPAATTTYVVTVTTPCGTGTASFVVTVISSPPVPAGVNSTICTGTSTTLNASGGSAYFWSPTTGLNNPNISNPVATPAATTTYVVTVTTPCGTETATFVVTVTSSPPVPAGVNSTICTGTSTTLNASGGSVYSWSPTTGLSNPNISNPVATPAATTTYVVTVTTPCGTGTASFVVTVTSSPPVPAGVNSTICTGGNITLNASGGSAYSWSPTTGLSNPTISNPVATPAATTTYVATVTTPCGSGTATFVVTVISSPPIPAGVNSTICTGTSTTLNASGGSAYSWSPTAGLSNPTISNPVATPAATTTYVVTVTTPCGTETATFVVTVSSTPVVPPGINSTICTGTSTTLNASGGSTYSWSPATGLSNPNISNPVASPLATTTYVVTVTTPCGVGTASFVITITSSPPIPAGVNSTICTGTSTTLNASGGSAYSWSPATGLSNPNISNPVASPAATTTYVVIVTTPCGPETATFVVTTISSPTVTVPNNTNICQGLTATLTATTSGATYAWSSGETTATINTTVAGSYSVVVSIGSCSDTAFITTTVVPNPNALVSPDITIIQGQSTVLTASGGNMYVWDNGDNGANITVSPPATTNYCVTVYDVNNCWDTACVTVNVELCANAGTLYLPNAFSPNGDKENDELQIYYGIPECIEKFHLVVYNRWGELVYETSDGSFKWDGRLDKKTVGTEVYIYHLEVDIVDGTKISRKGNISLIR